MLLLKGKYNSLLCKHMERELVQVQLRLDKFQLVIMNKLNAEFEYHLLGVETIYDFEFKVITSKDSDMFV